MRCSRSLASFIRLIHALAGMTAVEKMSKYQKQIRLGKLGLADVAPDPAVSGDGILPEDLLGRGSAFA